MIRARRSLGQNFLVDPNLQRRIVQAVDPRPEDFVLEIGPGTGALTRHLAGRPGRLVAIDLDGRCIRALERELGGRTDVELRHGDVLELDLASITGDAARLKVVGNIPYNITTPIVFRLLEPRTRPLDIVLMVQREVADRILAEPGGREYGALSVGVRTVARAERLFDVGRRAFRPVPDVDSSVIRITPVRPPPLTEAEERAVRVLTRAAFSRRRKQLGTILRSA
ncbi:MAG: 16S rRNA (adenine(1518)-N(6)/adenine(1519)-N(6))-dimethyltransferase RsmA, partial [Longimicrobiales bacterium]